MKTVAIGCLVGIAAALAQVPRTMAGDYATPPQAGVTALNGAPIPNGGLVAMPCGTVRALM
jgi:hypothetical protein